MRACPGLVALGALLFASPASGAPADAVRTGGPSAPGDAKRAVVLTSGSVAGRSFTVRDERNRTVLRGRLRRARGRAAPWRHAAVADLTAVRDPGAYRVRAPGLRASRPWVVTAAGGGSAPLRHVLRFFAVNADGREPSPAHGPSHLNDAVVRGGSLDGRHVDLTGGWMDAGDTMKFTQTTSFSVVALLLAARLDPVDAPALREAAGAGVRWLVKAHPAPDTFISQVGDIEADHGRDPAEGFDPAADDSSSVPALARRQALTGVGYDSGGRTAAALALAAQSEPDPGARAGLIALAREWYAAGEAAKGIAPRLPQDPYPSTAGEDDMALAAVELHLASGEPQDLADAIDWLKGNETDEAPNWDNVAVLAGAELCGLLGLPAPSEQARAAGCPLVAGAARRAARTAGRHALAAAGDLGFGTTAIHGGGGLALALGARAGVPSGRALAADARDWLLGRNAWGASVVAGRGPRAPRRIHHWAVRRGPRVFAGAVVGGPADRATLARQKLLRRAGPHDGPAGFYEDRTANYVTSEVAIDYAAGSVLMLAALTG